MAEDQSGSLSLSNPTVQKALIAVGVLLAAVVGYNIGTSRSHVSPWSPSCADDTILSVSTKLWPDRSQASENSILPPPPLNIALASGVVFDVSYGNQTDSRMATLGSWHSGDSVSVCKDTIDEYYTITDHNRPDYNQIVDHLEEQSGPTK
jgi:hypothetical protein